MNRREALRGIGFLGTLGGLFGIAKVGEAVTSPEIETTGEGAAPSEHLQPSGPVEPEELPCAEEQRNNALDANDAWRGNPYHSSPYSDTGTMLFSGSWADGWIGSTVIARDGSRRLPAYYSMGYSVSDETTKE